MNILGTHDTPRILTVLGKRGRLEKERSRMAEEKLTQEEKSGAIKMLKCCSLLQFCLYGVPCIYYGDEQITEGNKDPFNRTFFVENENKELYEWYCFLSELRKQYDCFKDGETADVYYNDGLFSFSRNFRAGKSCGIFTGIRASDFCKTFYEYIIAHTRAKSNDMAKIFDSRHSIALM